MGQRRRVGERRVELRAVGECERAADLGDELVADELALALESPPGAAEAALAELPVGRPVVSSNARRAAAMARSMSSAPASATWPMTSSVAGLMLSNALPDAASTSSPSMSIRSSPRTIAVGSCVVVVISAPPQDRSAIRGVGRPANRNGTFSE